MQYVCYSYRQVIGLEYVLKIAWWSGSVHIKTKQARVHIYYIYRNHSCAHLMCIYSDAATSTAGCLRSYTLCEYMEEQECG